MHLRSPRPHLAASLLVLALAGCQEKFEMVTVALDSATDFDTDPTLSGTDGTGGTGMDSDTNGDTEGTGTDGTASSTAGTTTGTTDPSSTSESTGPETSTTTDATTTDGTTTTDATTGSTTSEPAPCDTAPDCTSPGDPDGNPGPTTVPYFRGRACVVKEAKPGQALPVRLEACLHPCLSINAYAFKHAYRCPGGACEATALLYFKDVVGANCPSDVFAKFDPAQCSYAAPIDINAGPLVYGGNEFSGVAPLVIPYLSNDQADEIANGANTSQEIWARVDSNTQEASRYFDVTVSDDAADAPAKCDDPELCDCRDVAF
ncbi:MAG: hypothetical protein R3A79_25200 [Nannocystaceae bacterium]